MPTPPGSFWTALLESDCSYTNPLLVVRSTEHFDPALPRSASPLGESPPERGASMQSGVGLRDSVNLEPIPLSVHCRGRLDELGGAT